MSDFICIELGNFDDNFTAIVRFRRLLDIAFSGTEKTLLTLYLRSIECFKLKVNWVDSRAYEFPH